MSDLVAIRTALLQPFAAAAAGLGVARIFYAATPKDVAGWPADSPVVRATVALPSRVLVAADAAPTVEQNGTLTLSWLFPLRTGMAVIAPAIEATVALYREQGFANGLRLLGDAASARVGLDATGRLRWDVTIPWQSIALEASHAGTPLLGTLPTLASALATVRSTWLTQVEQSGAGWSGLPTFYDDEPALAAPPALPWAGYWVAPSAFGGPETSSGVETVLGRGLVQVHTDPSLGEAEPLAICNRIASQHNRTVQGVAFGVVETLRQHETAARTLQTNLRVPFSFQRLRPL